MMSSDPRLKVLGRIGTGLCFILFPITWIFAFWAHPNLLEPSLHGLTPEQWIRRTRGDALLQLGHALVTLNTVAMVPITTHYMYLLGHSSNTFLGFFGAMFAILGAFLLGAKTGAVWLTMGALDALETDEFEQMMPSLVAIFSFEGWMFLVWGMVLMALGVLLQIWALMREKILPQRQLRLLFVGILFIGFPDGAEIINLIAAILMAVAMVPYGVKLIKGDEPGKKSD
jgi:hypothetical protein